MANYYDIVFDSGLVRLYKNMKKMFLKHVKFYEHWLMIFLIENGNRWEKYVAKSEDMLKILVKMLGQP